MSLYLGKAGRRILNFTVTHPRLDRAVNTFGKAARKITFGRYMPELTRTAFLVYQRTAPGDEISLQKDGFYRNGEKIAGNAQLSKRAKKAGFPPVRQRSEKDTPEFLAQVLRLKRHASVYRFSFRDFKDKSLFFIIGNLCANAYQLFLARNSMVAVKTPDANFYGWFNRHDGSASLPLEELRSIAGQEKNLIIVPEIMGFTSLHDVLFRRREIAETSLRDDHVTKEAREFILESWIPIFLADLIADPPIIDELHKSKDDYWPNFYLYYVIQSLLLGVPLGLLTSHKMIARRKLLAYALGSAIALGVPIISGGRDWLATLTKPYTRDYDFMVDFRNAMIAAKILRLTAFLREKGIKPAFLIIMGTAHREIMKNLEMGMEYNLEIIREFDSRTVSLGSYWDKGYLMDGPYFDGGHVIDKNNPLGTTGFQEIKIFEK